MFTHAPFFSDPTFDLFPDDFDVSFSVEFVHMPNALMTSHDAILPNDPGQHTIPTDESTISSDPIANSTSSDHCHRTRKPHGYLYDYHYFSIMLNLHELSTLKEAFTNSQ